MKVLIYDSGFGVIPFIEFAINNHKLHDYYLYLDEDVFPLGKKSEEFIISHLKQLLIKFREDKYDIIIFACNTMAAMLGKIDITEYDVKIYSIFKINQDLINDNCIFLGTKVTIKQIACSSLDGTHLPELIEKRMNEALIIAIKKLKISSKRVILGCTHFPLVTHIFKTIYPNVEFVDGHRILMDMIPSGDDLSLSGTNKGLKVIKEFFPKYVS